MAHNCIYGIKKKNKNKQKLKSLSASQKNLASREERKALLLQALRKAARIQMYELQ